jgi:uncharacterized UBP type Zn finger protein
VPFRTTLKFAGQFLSGIGVHECEHVSEMISVEPPDARECAGCRAAGKKWVHLRMCMTCGYVGCCESSSLSHMRAHAEQTGHPIARSIERWESWLWCYKHERLVRRRL